MGTVTKTAEHQFGNKAGTQVQHRGQLLDRVLEQEALVSRLSSAPTGPQVHLDLPGACLNIPGFDIKTELLQLIAHTRQHIIILAQGRQAIGLRVGPEWLQGYGSPSPPGCGASPRTA